MWSKVCAAVAAVTLLAAIQGIALEPGVNDYDYDSFCPIHSRGHVDNVFEVNGLDDINLFNGNLTASIPLGPPLHPGGDLTFQLALRYNSMVWAFETDLCLSASCHWPCNVRTTGSTAPTSSPSPVWVLLCEAQHSSSSGV